MFSGSCTNDSLGHLGQVGHTLGTILISLPQISKAWAHSMRVQRRITLVAGCTRHGQEKGKGGGRSPVLEEAGGNKGLDSH